MGVVDVAAAAAAAAAAAFEGFAFAFLVVPDFESLSESLFASAPSLAISFAAALALEGAVFFLVGVVVVLFVPASVDPDADWLSPGVVELASPEDTDALAALGLSSISLSSEVESLAFSITARLLDPLFPLEDPLVVFNGELAACFFFAERFVRGPASDESLE